MTDLKMFILLLRVLYSLDKNWLLYNNGPSYQKILFLRVSNSDKWYFEKLPFIMHPIRCTLHLHLYSNRHLGTCLRYTGNNHCEICDAFYLTKDSIDMPSALKYLRKKLRQLEADTAKKETRLT